MHLSDETRQTRDTFCKTSDTPQTQGGETPGAAFTTSAPSGDSRLHARTHCLLIEAPPFFNNFINNAFLFINERSARMRTGGA